MPKRRRREPQITVTCKKPVYASEAERDAARAQFDAAILALARLLARAAARDEIARLRRVAEDEEKLATAWATQRMIW
jgi:hypothetical protein